MLDLDLGWAWFDTGSSSSDHEQSPEPADQDLAHVFARCFRGEEGVKVLGHLRSITQNRILGPTASDALLRHVEGQRQLVAQIISLVEQGGSHSQVRDYAPKHSCPAIMENTDD